MAVEEGVNNEEQKVTWTVSAQAVTAIEANSTGR